MTVEERGTETWEAPPTSLLGTLRHLGPGLIIAGSIVGSGELIATTKTGAEAGFWLLWLILIGCVIKVFAQVEFGRYSVVTGRTTMEGLAEVPGPRIRNHGNWIVWYWFVMFVASISQLGGIVGGVGQALAISIPLTAEGREYNEYVDLSTELQVRKAELLRLGQLDGAEDPVHVAGVTERVDRLQIELAERDKAWIAELGEAAFREQGGKPRPPKDDRIWATLVAMVTVVLLVVGHYGLIQSFSTVMVALFTLVTLVNLFLLQSNPAWSVQWSDIVQGMKFRLPPSEGTSTTALTTALATFGIIGVGAAELIAYPYWCLEKGYARFTGPRENSPAWAERARGWMRVMRWDAWCSMVTYTFATLAFYLLGAAILGRTGLNPEKNEMIRTLGVMYEPVFGTAARGMFLFGAFAVLYSTYFVANAGHARVFADAVQVLGFGSKSPESYRRLVKVLSGIFPALCLLVYLAVSLPAKLVLFGGLMQAIMLPMLALAALFFRYQRCDARVAPGRFWDIGLWISAIGMSIAGIWALVSQLWG